MATLTWGLPHLLQYNVDWPSVHNNYWYVTKFSEQKDSEGYAEDTCYLGRDGKFHPFMRERSGTYFATLQEAINVLCKFEIDVGGPEHQDD